MTNKNNWQRFFDAHAGSYEEEIFTKNTKAEIEFLLEELDLPPGGRVLDLGCGTGRHAIGLALAGYQVTGVDISPGMLAQARQRADAAGVSVEWVQSDARLYASEPRFDAAISLCEGALCLLVPEDDAMLRDLTVLRNMSQALISGGKLIITVLNACRMIRQVTEEDLRKGNFVLETLTEPEMLAFETPAGVQTLAVRERYYTPPEMTRMLVQVGITVEQIWGGTAGAWNRKPLRLDEMEMMVVGRKTNADDSDQDEVLFTLETLRAIREKQP